MKLKPVIFLSNRVSFPETMEIRKRYSDVFVTENPELIENLILDYFADHNTAIIFIGQDGYDTEFYKIARSYTNNIAVMSVEDQISSIIDDIEDICDVQPSDQTTASTS